MVKESPSCNLYLPCESAYAEPSWKATCVGVNPVTTSPTQSTSFASGRYRPVVNPHYNQTKGEITLPTGSWRLLDAATDPVRAAITGSCPEYGQVPYLPLVAAPASSLSKITLAMEFAELQNGESQGFFVRLTEVTSASGDRRMKDEGLPGVATQTSQTASAFRASFI